MKTDILIVGSGCSGLYAALHLPKDRQITVITKSDAVSCDSYLAQGGICMLRSAEDYSSYFEDTMKAGHYENDPGAVDLMIRSSRDVIRDLIGYGTRFQRDADGNLAFTREGAHSESRILYHKDITGKEITDHLLARALELPNLRLLEHTTLIDLITEKNTCRGALIRHPDGSLEAVQADVVILATGGVGGLYRHSTNFRHLTGDALAIAIRHGIRLRDLDYVQIHPTTLYSADEEDRAFLISESVRGEGARLYGRDGRRFTNELLPRDLLTREIRIQMQKDRRDYVLEDMTAIPELELAEHFPNIIDHCREKGYDAYRECIPVCPAQHYFMGGIAVDYESRTSMERLYAVGETACNGVHGRNRLASNSLLESLVFAKRAAKQIALDYQNGCLEPVPDFRIPELSRYADAEGLDRENRGLVLQEMQKHAETRRHTA